MTALNTVSSSRTMRGAQRAPGKEHHDQVDDRGRDQDDLHEVLVLLEEGLQPRLLLLAGQLVGAILLQALRRLGRAQPLRRIDLQLFGDGLGGQGVPDLFLFCHGWLPPSQNFAGTQRTQLLALLRSRGQADDVVRDPRLVQAIATEKTMIATRTESARVLPCFCLVARISPLAKLARRMPTTTTMSVGASPAPNR